MKKIISIALLTLMVVFALASCDYDYTDYGTAQDVNNTISVANKLQQNQPTPSDIDYSLERYNLIRRAYWVNGQREKADALPCAVEKPLGYIVLFTDNGAAVGSFVVDGKVSSLNSYLTPDSEYYEQKVYGSYGSQDENRWLADVDGSYGTNDNGIFFFDVRGNYFEWTGKYLYTDVPMEIKDPVVQFKVNTED